MQELSSGRLPVRSFQPQLLLIALLLTGLLFSTTTYADTSVWKIEKGDSTVYFGGTIHILRSSDYPLPEAFYQAYHASQRVIFETDTSKLNSPELAKEMLHKLSYQDERTIASEITRETWMSLKKYASSFGISLELMQKAKPGMLMSSLMVHELNKLGANHEGIDAHFLKLARKDNKPADFLETPQEQIDFLAQTGIGNENTFYQNMLRDFKNTRTFFSNMIEHWRSGNNDKLDALINQTMKKEAPRMYRSLLIERNNKWLPDIEKYFLSEDVEFVLVGTAHLIGEDGIINSLKAKGYQVTRL